MSFLPATTKAPVTTTRATTKAPVTTTRATTTTTTARPTLAPQEYPGQFPPDAVDLILALFDLYPQLQGKEDEILSSTPNNGPDPLMATVGSLPKELQDIMDCLYKMVQDHPAGTPWDMNTEMTCFLSVPVATA